MNSQITAVTETEFTNLLSNELRIKQRCAFRNWYDNQVDISGVQEPGLWEEEDMFAML